MRAFVTSTPLYRDDDDPGFWPAERLAARRDELLQRQLSWLAEASPYYQACFAREHIDPTTIKSVADLVRLPVTTKADLMSDPAAFRLRFASPSIYDMTYTTVYTTGTTTGRPTPYEYAGHDYLGALLAGRRVFKMSYIMPGDLYLSLFPLSPLPHVAGFAGMFASAAGVSFQHGMTGSPYADFPVHLSTRGLARKIAQLRPQALSGIGSFLRRMIVDAARDGCDFSSLKVVLASGEVFTERMRAHLRATLARCGAEDVFIASGYSFTEGGVGWSPCYEGGPMHPSAPDQIYLETLDPKTYERLPDGAVGLLAATHLNRRGMPLLRYVLGDLTALSRERCSVCGRAGESLLVSAGSAHVTRTSELLKIKGTLVNPQVIHEVVMNTAGVTEYQMIVAKQDPIDPDSPDKLVMRIGLDSPGEDQVWTERQSQALRQAIFNATEVRPEIELVADLSQIYDPIREVKARRIVDQRPGPA
jgi:phenylacetate-CoA ligase